LSSLSGYQNVPVLVTGHTGFKGAWLCQALHRLGAKVSGYALSPEEPSLYSVLNLNIPQKIADIRDFSSLLSFMKEQRPRIVFHLAAQAFVSVGRKEPIDTFSTNVMGLVHVLEAAVQSGVEAVVVISTDKVYKPQDMPCSTESRLGGLDPYSASKAASEFVIPPYRDRIHISIARSGNAIGGGDWGIDRLFPDIMRAHKKNTVLDIRHPQATRPWVHVSELIRAYLILGNNTLQGKCLEAFNFGATESLSVEKVLLQVQKNGIDISLEICENPPKETQTLELDCTKSTEKISWSTRISPQESIQWTIEEYALLTEPQKLLEVMWSRMGVYE
jgi:CDP-glucose 4,6-dehydratase